MKQAAGCGIPPLQFYRMTLGEIMVAMQGQMDAERRRTAAQVDATMRAISATFGKNSDPYRGLVDTQAPQVISPQQVRQLRFWSSANG